MKHEIPWLDDNPVNLDLWAVEAQAPELNSASDEILDEETTGWDKMIFPI